MASFDGLSSMPFIERLYSKPSVSLVELCKSGWPEMLEAVGVEARFPVFMYPWDFVSLPYGEIIALPISVCERYDTRPQVFYEWFDWSDIRSTERYSPTFIIRLIVERIKRLKFEAQIYYYSDVWC